MKKLFVAGLMACFCSFAAWGSITVYEFEEEQQREQFDQLIQELRCPKCQNQNIADSDAGVAKLIKDRVYKLVKQGQDKDQITDHMVARYGEFVTYRPAVKKSTFLLWFGPVLFLVLAVIALVIFVRKNNAPKPAGADQGLSKDEHQKVQDLLNKYSAEDDQK